MRTIEQLHATAKAPGPGAAGLPEAGPGSRSDRGERVITECKDWKAWEKLAEKKEMDEVLGMSPGGVAGRLGVSRQRVHQMIDEGCLDAVKVKDRGMGYAVVYVTEASVRREIERRKKVLDK